MINQFRYTPVRNAAIQSYLESLPKGVGDTQRKVLKCLIEFGTWCLSCGWKWGTPLQTKQMLDGLVNRGLVIRTEGKQEYFPAVQFDEEGNKVNQA